MKISYNTKKMNTIISALESKNQIRNGFIEFELYGSKSDKVEVRSLIDGSVLDYITDISLFKNIFEYAERYQGRIIDDETIEIYTSIPLHTHSEYSILDGANRVKDMVMNYPYAGAITDHGVMYGTLDFYKEMTHASKKPIIGFEAYTEDMNGNKGKYHLILLVKNETGYKNIIKLCTLGQANFGGKFPAKPLISHEDIKKYSEGIICLSACIGGEIPQKIIEGKIIEAKACIEEFKSIFGDDFYLEIQRHASMEIIEEELKEFNKVSNKKYTSKQALDLFKKDEMKCKETFPKYLFDNIELCVQEPIVNEKIIELSKMFNVKLVATTDSHYTKTEDKEMHEVLLCNQTGKKISDEKRMRFSGTGYHLLTTDEMEELFGDIPESLYNSVEISNKVSYDFEFGNYKLPKFDIPEGMTEREYFEKIVWDGFEERYLHKGYSSEFIKGREDRLKFELEVIFNMGYQGYFFIVWDYINWAKANDIAVGPGRGSGAGSEVLFCLHITEQLDPLEYDLLFERFLNPDRISMPDIDTDFEFERRQEVVTHCKEKYGDECVSSIITFGRMAAKQSVLDVARIYDYSPSFARGISNLIPKEPNITLEAAMIEIPDLSQRYETEEDVKKIMDMAMKLEGLVRNTSVHACGKIIAPSDVSDYIPLCYVINPDTGVLEATTQFTMTEVEEVGLLKMDFLGLRTETVINNSIKDINRLYGKNLTLYEIPIDDVNAYIKLAKGKTSGVFQLESSGITSVITQLYQDIELRSQGMTEEEKLKLGKECFERLIAGISLYRPGPMAEIPRYIEGMLDSRLVSYDDPSLESILKSTYGVMVYQEQVMNTVKKLAGFTAGQADMIRKAMGKKKMSILNEFKPYFISGSDNKLDPHTNLPYDIKGCVDNGIPEETANIIWTKMEDFAKYAFNKSHGGAYAVVCAQTAWLSCYYPEILIKNNLNAYITNKDKVPYYLNYCRSNNIPILPPSVNESEEFYSLTKDGKGIRVGLKGIKNVATISLKIVEEREKNGKFKSFEDFIERMIKRKNEKVITANALESLVKVGAFDEFPLSRAEKLAIALKLVDLYKILYPKNNTIFNLAQKYGIQPTVKLAETEVEELTEDDILDMEEECAGIYITGHPLLKYQMTLKGEEGYESIMNIKEVEEDRRVKTAGIIARDSIKRIPYKNGSGFLIKFTLKDLESEVECICFHQDYEKNVDHLFEKNKIIIEGDFSVTDFGPQIILKSVSTLLKEDKTIRMINIYSSNDVEQAREQYTKCTTLVENNPGKMPVIFYRGKDSYTIGNIDLRLQTFTELQEISNQSCKVC